MTPLYRSKFLLDSTKMHFFYVFFFLFNIFSPVVTKLSTLLEGGGSLLVPLQIKWIILKISSVNLTKYPGNCKFDHIYWKNPDWKTSFVVRCVHFISKICKLYRKTPGSGSLSKTVAACWYNPPHEKRSTESSMTTEE